MYLMNFTTRTAPAARQLSGCSGFFRPRTPLTRRGTPPRRTPGEGDTSDFYAGGGLKKPTGPTGPAVPAPADSGGGRYLRFLRGWGPQKTHWTHWPRSARPGGLRRGDTTDFYAGGGLKKPTGPTGPHSARPRPLPVHDLPPRGPQTGPLRPLRPRGSTTPMAPLPGSSGGHSVPQRQPRPKSMKRLGYRKSCNESSL